MSIAADLAGAAPAPIRIERSVPAPIVQRFSGHADNATTMRYCSIADDVYADRIVSALG